MAKVLTNEWTTVRVVDLPLVADDDWRLTNDIAGFLAASEVFTIVPKANTTGSFQVALVYLDAAGGIVVPAENARLTVQTLQITNVAPRVDIASLARRVLMKAGPELLLLGEEIVTGEIVGKFKQDIGMRMISTMAEPAGATKVTVIARFA